MLRTTSRWLVGSEAMRLLRSETARISASIHNTFGSATRTARLRAARQVLMAVGVAAGITWGVGWLATSDATLGLDSARRLSASAFLLFVFIVDGVGLGVWTRTRWEGRFSDQWLPTSGVHPAAVALRHAVLLTLRALLFSWLPLLPVHADLLGFSVVRRLPLLLAGPACSLTGDAIGVLSRRGSRWIGVAFAAGGVFYWGSLFTLFLWGNPWSDATLVPARTLLLSGWNVAATVVFFALAVVANALMNWWGSERARARAAFVRGSSRALQRRPGAIRPTSESMAHAQAAIRRLSAWVSQQWIASGVVGAYALLPIAALTLGLSHRAGTLTASQAVWPLAISLALPALVCSEILWGTLPRDMWALYRINARSLYVPVTVPGAITLSVLLLWVAIGAAILVIATPGGGPSAVRFFGVGVLLAAHCASVQGYAGALALRSEATRTAFGRVVRYAGTAAGVLLPALLLDRAGPSLTTAWVGVVAVAAPAGAVAQFSRCQFGHGLRTE